MSTDKLRFGIIRLLYLLYVVVLLADHALSVIWDFFNQILSHGFDEEVSISSFHYSIVISKKLSTSDVTVIDSILEGCLALLVFSVHYLFGLV